MLLLLLTGCLYDRPHYLELLAEFSDDDGDSHPGYDDCNDADPAIHPGQDEICDGLDNDCNNQIDDEALDIQRWYQDLDQDGFGTTEISRESCISPTGYADNGDDCDDGDDTVYPGASESCAESIDQNCDGRPGNLDEDEDGSPACVDCNDTDPAIHPGQTEVCDFVDQNCDNQVDNNAQDARLWYLDADGDGFGDTDTEELACFAPSGEYITAPGDCNDRDAAIKPGIQEVCGDGEDNNCNGIPDGCRPAGDLQAGIFLTILESNDIKGLGDVNGDGYADLAVGWRTYSADDGMLAMVLGPVATGTSDLESIASLFVTGTTGHQYMGLMTPALDYDGDGQVEIATSSSDLPNRASNIHLISMLRRGQASVEDAEFAHLSSTADEWSDLGELISGDVDIDGDGADELLISAPQAYHQGVPESGIIHRVSGNILSGQTAASVAKTTFVGDDSDLLGDMVLQDVNGDGEKDYLLSAAANSQGGLNAGMIYTFYGPRTGVLQMAEADVAQPGVAGEYLGWPLVKAGDADGDGLEDMWASSQASAMAGTDAGAAYLLPATATSRDARANAIAILTGESSGDAFSFSVTSSDVDGDGVEDAWIGAIGQDQGGSNAGKAYLFYGPFAGTRGARSAEGSYVGARVGGSAGYAVAMLGDMNGDGQDDLGLCEWDHVSILLGYSF